MQLTKQKIKDIVEAKTNQDFEKWKAEQLENHMLMLMKKDKDYRHWEDQFIESKVMDMLISDAEKAANKSNNLGGKQ